MEGLRLAACCTLLLAYAVNGEVPRQCQPHSRSSGNLPKLPNAFTATIQANIVRKNYSSLMTEYYDDAKNRGALTVVSGRGNGFSRHKIFSYNSSEVISIDKVSGKCHVYPLDKFHARLFGPGFPMIDGKPHIRGVTNVLHFGSQYNETYMGLKYIRGILCDHWQACIVHNHSSFTLDYYFSSSGWNNSHGNLVQPVRAVVNGTKVSRRRHNDSEADPKPHSFYNIYDFFSFVVGSPDDKEYEIPRGTFCPGKKNTNNATLLAPKWFSFETETVSVRHKAISHHRDFYDYEQRLFRIDHQNRSRQARDRVYQSQIHDYNAGISYTISNRSGVPSCQISVLPNHTWDRKQVDSQHELKTAKEFLFLTNFSQFGYSGVGSIRGFEADVWSVALPQSNMTVEMYYLRPEWKFNTDTGAEERRILLRWTVYGQFGPWVNNIYNFDAKPQEMNVYDISACFSRERKHRLELSFRRINPDIAIDEHVLGKALRLNVSQTAKVEPIRVADIKVWRFPQTFDSLTVTFVLLDSPGPDLKGKTKNVRQEDTPLKKALQDLEQSVTRGSFHIEFAASDGTVIKLTADPGSLIIDGALPSNSSPTKRRSCEEGWSDGEAVGLAIGLMLLGIIAGVLIGCLFRKDLLTSLFSFNRFTNSSAEEPPKDPVETTQPSRAENQV